MTEDCAVVGTNVVNYVAARNMDTVTYSVVWFRALFLFRKKIFLGGSLLYPYSWYEVTE